MLVALALLLPPATAGEGASRVRVGGDPDYPPHHFLDAQGQARGFDVDILREIAADRGLQLEFSFGEWNAVLARLERGELDVVPMFVSDDRRQRFLFTQAFDYRHHRLFGHVRPRPLTGLADLAGKRVAVQFGGMAWEWLNNQEAGARVVSVNHEESALAAVAEGRADFALVPADIGQRAIARLQLDDIVALGPPMIEREYAFGVSRARPDLVAELNAGLARIESSDRLLALRMAWRDGGTGRERGSRRLAWAVAAVAAVLSTAVLVWFVRRPGRAET